tara:strand:+ start:359 stop:1096 length:738 start_codon:yes stop_codon:yes gene_type:complete
MYLIIDIGNTEIKTCLVNGRFKIIKKIIFKTKKIEYSILKKNLKFIKKKNLKIKETIISSVVPNAFLIIKSFLKKEKVKFKELKKYKISKVLKISVNLKQVGSDRLANAISVKDQKNNFIIIDFGTATTFDIVLKNRYLGGVIAPGIKLSLNTLISNASLIPEMSLSKIYNVVGKNTKAAVKSGFYLGYIGLIEKIVYLIKKQTKKKFKIIMTGGYSHLFQKALNFRNNIDKDLTIKGLIKVLKI